MLKISKPDFRSFFSSSPFDDHHFLHQDIEKEPPLRAELFNTYQMEKHARVLASQHSIATYPIQDSLLKRLAENEQIIQHACQEMVRALKENRQITPAAEWLLDNFYLIEEQIRTAKTHLPKGYSRGLPRLEKGPSAGLPRVYDISLAVISHGDAHLDLDILSHFIDAYQKITPLKIGELWAIPIMLRLALIENLRRVAVRLVTSHTSRNLADHWADQIIETADKDSTDLLLLTADMARSNPPLNASFVAELSRRLQGQGPALALPLTWVEQHLYKSGNTVEQLVYSEIQQQAADQVSISNSIGSLRALVTINWRKFVESLSAVEQVLLQDPAGMYAHMDFATRDRYRHSVEAIAKSSRLSEQEVAQNAILLAQQAEARGDDDKRTQHVGYFLIDNGLPQLEQAVRMRISFFGNIRRTVQASPLFFYLGSVTLLTTAITVVLTNKAQEDGAQEGLLYAIIVLSILGASHLAVSLVNWLATMLAKPHPLPRMDFAKHIPDTARTLVAVPTMISSVEGIDELVEALEVRFLANRRENLRFALLTDLKDAENETLPDDAILVEHASGKIDALNQYYAAQGEDIFFLFHRPRLWNAREKQWMGYERKRGKLGALNQLLYKNDRTAFSTITGNIDNLTGIKYVITLDTDTQLPRDAAWQFAATMAHPLNRPYYDAEKGRVTQGYGIIQPRVAANLPGSDASIYAQLSAGEPGIDPYTRTVSDVYQDAFREGSFIGKGIYDVEIFEAVLKDAFPENRILSHDLLEGCYIRSGLLSDVQLYEEYPSRYKADVSRRHRWIRGDWQVARWLFSYVPAKNGKQRNNLSSLSLWKIADNLRRSMVAPALVLLLLAGWLASPSPAFWTTAVITLLLLPCFSMSILDFARKPKEISMREHLAASLFAAGRHFFNVILSFICLPHEAYYSLHATLVALWRISVTRRHLLEWVPSSEANGKGDTSISEYARMMWFAPLLSASVFAVLWEADSIALPYAAPVLFFWFLSPFIMWKLSIPAERKQAELNTGQTAYLGMLSRKIWAFFETYVGPEDNWLPPDNVQEEPLAVTAHRTSPTNMGLSLLANLSAYGFGYIGTGQFITRTDNSLRTMSMMERHAGHFYNWYDTQTLAPLHPMYISAVDSGNLAGHLMVLRMGLLSMANKPIVNSHIWRGLSDTLTILQAASDETLKPSLQALQNKIDEAKCYNHFLLSDIKQVLEALLQEAESALELVTTESESEASWWLQSFLHQCRTCYAELITLAPWLAAKNIASWIEKLPELNHVPSLQALSNYKQSLVPQLRKQDQTLAEEEGAILDELCQLIEQGSQAAQEYQITLLRLAEQSGEMANMEFDFLYNKENHLLAIGYNISERRLDASYYDLLASEARLAVFVAIAQGKLPQESWFALGRKLASTSGNALLLSWSGSMFEYLMPLLIMPDYEKTLLNQTYKSVVKRQIEYGHQKNVPWGISESGYYLFDAHLNYQYRAFGVPETGLKRGLGEDLVIAPYASAMGLMVLPEEACKNMQRLSKEGFEGRFGHYEAIDYTPSRLPRGKAYATIQSYMVHHQGMSFLSLAYLLQEKPMQALFKAEPLFQATMLLLHEKMPKAAASRTDTTELEVMRITASDDAGSSLRVFNQVSTPVPEVQLLSNGRYHVMVTSAGGSSSRWKDLAVTRWREDATRDNWGTFCYMRDVESGDFWSTTYQPTLKKPDNYEVIFSEGRAEFKRRDHEIDLHTEIIVSPEDDIELRRTRITNRSRVRRVIEITSYAEIVMAPVAADAAHPAFSNLFVQTEILHKRHAILSTRRARSATEQPAWMFHLMTMHGAEAQEVSYETDRMKFIGRGNNLSAPSAMTETDMLSDSEGSVLDPIVAIRYRIILDPEKSAVINVVTGAGETREICRELVHKYQDSHLADRVLELAWTQSQVILRHLNATEADAQLYSQLASPIVYANGVLRADASTIIKNRRGQSGLWSYAISGDLPIVLLQIRDSTNIELVRQMIQAHAYWRLKGLAVDLVIWHEDHAGYRQLLHEQILGLITAGMGAHVIDHPGGIFVRPIEQIPPEDRILLESVARVVLTDSKGTLTEQLTRIIAKEPSIPRLIPTLLRDVMPEKHPLPTPERLFFNEIGGFSADGREYIITVDAEHKTPAPWSNIVANPTFGSVISENGQSYTWSENAHEFRLTPWHNDPVSDAGGEAFYIRDQETGHFWSPTPRPVVSDLPYTTFHGFGYSRFEHIEDGIYSELKMYVDLEEPIKFFALKIRNDSGRTRKLSVAGYIEWVMGDLRTKSAMHVVTEIDRESGALLARNSYNSEFSAQIAFLDMDDRGRTVTGDRKEFIGRNGTLQHPNAMNRVQLSGKTGAGLDPCGAMHTRFQLADGEERDIIFRLGIAGTNRSEVSEYIRRFKGTGIAQQVFEKVNRYWKDTLSAVQVETPDASINILANGWLMYQTIACRIWARSGYYQSGGAFGFRDQLQDMMALIHAKPLMLREHLLLSASRQFIEGDVQHWWHPPVGRGVRTKCSDDYLWLPLATCRYVSSTGDIGVLDEPINFLEGRELKAEEESYYDLPGHSSEKASLYQHCVRAIMRGLRFGEHGLPLIGSCDWNDGMDKVGEHGKGESVWLAFFLYDVLTRFTDIAIIYGDEPFAKKCEEEAEKLRRNIDNNAWDGKWYRRAYFDDGTPLGSAKNEECQIDSISQSWSILSGAGDPERSQIALEEVDKRLVRRDHQLIQLLDPPFDKAGKNPGYIRGYVPGVRENGGQYTHAAIWTTMAFAKLGNSEKTWELLQMINPLNHGRTPEEVATYRVEPYVIAADIYGVAPHTGRGGWTWYTGSAGWMYQLILESVLGLKLRVNTLTFKPCIPADWNGFKITYRYRSTTYSITVRQSTDQKDTITIDGEAIQGNEIIMEDDLKHHTVEINI